MIENKMQELKSRNISFKELIQWSADIYYRTFRYIALICFCVYLPVYVILQLLPAQLLITPMDITLQNIDKIMMFSYFVIGIFILFDPLATAALTSVTHQALNEEEISIPAILDASLQKWLKLVLTSLFIVVIIILTSCLLALSIYFALAFCFAINIVAVSNIWGFEALGKSRKLIFGFKKFAVLLFLLYGVGGIVVNQTLMLISSDFGVAVQMFCSIIGDLLLSFFKIMFAIFFFNLFYSKN